MFSLEGKVAIVTGGGSGIGLAVVQRCASAGGRVVIADLTDQSDLATDVGGKFVQTDVSSDEAVSALLHEAVQWGGGVHVFVNNAGIALDAIDEDVTEVADETYRRLFEVNSLGVAHGVKHAARHMSDGGSIVNVSSLSGVYGFPGFPAYAMSKAAVVGLTRAAALQLAPRGIRVNAVCPGFINTPMTAAVEADYAAFGEIAVPLGRLGDPDEIAAAVHFFASDDASFVTGQSINVGGGLSTGISAGMLDAIFGAE